MSTKSTTSTEKKTLRPLRKIFAPLRLCEKLINVIRRLYSKLQYLSVYHKCSNIPLHNFIELYNDNDKAIKRLPFATKATIAIAKNMLQTEFAVLTGEKTNAFPQRRAIRLRIIINQLHSLLELYDKTNKHSPQIKQKICEMTSTNDIYTSRRILSNWTKKLEQEEERLKKEFNNKKTNFTFEDTVIEIEKENKFYINRKTTTVVTFAGYVKSFKRKIESYEKQKKQTLKK